MGETTTFGYQSWLQQEQIPIVEGYSIEDVKKVELWPWQRLGASGAYVRLVGSEDITGMYVCEISEGGKTKPERHLFEEVIYGIQGRGRALLWDCKGRRASIDWQAGSLFAVPLNTFHEFQNLGDEAARFFAVTSAPLLLNLYRDPTFIFDCELDFPARYGGNADHFQVGRHSGDGETEITWRVNYVRNIDEVELVEVPSESSHGISYRRRSLSMSGNTLHTFIAEYPAGTYTTAHWHAPGYHILIAQGEGFTLLWPREAGLRPFENGQGDQVVRIDWRPGSVFVPPGGWFHQQFNSGAEPVVYAPTGPAFLERTLGSRGSAAVISIRDGGNQIDYELEDPRFRELFESELKQKGLLSRMGEVPRP